MFSVCCPVTLDSCEELFSPHYYYSCYLKCNSVATTVGFLDLRLISDELKKGFQNVHPVCTECFSNGKKECTRGPRFAGGKRTASEYIYCNFLSFSNCNQSFLYSCILKTFLLKSNAEIAIEFIMCFRVNSLSKNNAGGE